MRGKNNCGLHTWAGAWTKWPIFSNHICIFLKEDRLLIKKSQKLDRIGQYVCNSLGYGFRLVTNRREIIRFTDGYACVTRVPFY